MNDYEIKTTAQLLDEFVTNQIKCFLAQDKIMDETLSDDERLKYALVAQKTNAKRTELIRILDSRFRGPGITNDTKTYDRSNK